MNVEETKQAMIALIESNASIKWDKRDSNLAEELRQAETASDVAVLLVACFDRLENYFGEEFLSIVKNSLSPDIWNALGVFVNPKYIPDCGYDMHYVLSDGTVKTVQDHNVSVSYYGDVDLTVKEGAAFVQDTKNRVKVEDNGFVVARGHTQVYATGHSSVDLQGHARGIVQDDVIVQTFGQSFVESIGGRPDITAYDQSRFLISEGSAKIEMFNFSRGMLISADNHRDPIKVLTGGEGLLYVGPGNPGGVLIKKKNADCVILDGQKQHITPEEIRDVIIPEYGNQKLRIGDSIQTSLDAERIKMDLSPYLPAWNQDWEKDMFAWASNEKEIAVAIKSYIPDMVQKGMTGEFLRSHFTEKTLHANRIFMNVADQEQLSSLLFDTELSPCYFFGDQLVNDRLCNAPVYGFEHTLVISSKSAEINASANAIVVGDGQLKANGTGKVFALNNANVEASNQVKLYLEGASKGVTNGSVYVKAYGESQLFGHGHTNAELYDRCMMVANDDSRVLALGDNELIMMGKTEVAFPNYETGHQANITIKSNETTLKGLDRPEQVGRYKASMVNDQSSTLIRSTGLGR